MFVCSLCKKPVVEGTTAERVIIETRPAKYEVRPNANRAKNKRSRYDQGGTGWEIVKEALACPACAKQVGPVPLPDEEAYAESEAA